MLFLFCKKKSLLYLKRCSTWSESPSSLKERPLDLKCTHSTYAYSITLTQFTIYIKWLLLNKTFAYRSTLTVNTYLVQWPVLNKIGKWVQCMYAFSCPNTDGVEQGTERVLYVKIHRWPNSNLEDRASVRVIKNVWMELKEAF